MFPNYMDAAGNVSDKMKVPKLYRLKYKRE